MKAARYIHGTKAAEQRRLAVLNGLTNTSFVDYLEIRGDESILEVGSGLGLLTREVARRHPRAKVVGIEYAPEQLRSADATGLSNLRFAQGDAHQLELGDETFDVVYCRWLLEHLADPLRALREMRRVLKPGGRIGVQENDVSLQRYDPDAPKSRRMWDRLVKLQARLGGDALIGGKLHGMLTKAGFTGVSLSLAPEVHQAGSPGFRIWIENQIGIFKGCTADLEKHHVATAAEVRDTVGELRDYLKRPHAASLFAWNRASAFK